MAMRAKIFRIILVSVLILVCFGGAYVIGYAYGHRAAVRDETEFKIVYNLALYKFEKTGDTNRLDDWLRFSIYAASDYYDRYFSNEVVTNRSFLKHLDEARAIASIERTQVVTVDLDSIVRQVNEEVRTNRMTNNVSEPN
jgi:hypothetical protein